MRHTLTRVKRKILVFNKMKHKGLSYDGACKELEGELRVIKKNEKPRGKPKKDFKTDFQKLCAGQGNGN